MNTFNKRLPIPSKHDINTGLSSCTARTLETIIGTPSPKLTQTCREPDNQKLLGMLITKDISHMHVRGLSPAVHSLTRIFERVSASLGEATDTAGMLCCRLIRGSLHTPSNHSWGTAIDLKIHGELVPMGANYTLDGLLKLYGFFHEEGWYWGAGFTRPDSMHFEVAEETVRKWHEEGLI